MIAKANLVARLTAFLVLSSPALPADDWPQWLGPQRDAVWRESGIIDRWPAKGPVVRWRTAIGSGYAGPAVANGRVYLSDRRLAQGVNNPSNPFQRGAVPGAERVVCLNEADGTIIWQHEYDCPYTVSYASGPRCTPLAAGGKVYTLGAEGNLVCLDATKGEVIWARDFRKDFEAKTPIWGFAGHPLLDGQRLICLVGGEKATAVAFDKDTGQMVWRALEARNAGYCPPTMITHAGRRLLIIWHAEAVNALEPETGKVIWTVPFRVRSELSIATPRLRGGDLFLTAFYDGSLMLRLDPTTSQPTERWRSKKVSEKDTDMLHSIMCTPFFDDGYIYGVCSYGQLRGLRAENGERLWETLAATTTDNKETRWANTFLVKNGSRFFLFNEKGDLIIAKLSPSGYEEISRAHLLDPTNRDPGRPVVWSHPAFANRSCYARNDKEIVCVSLAAEK